MNSRLSCGLVNILVANVEVDIYLLFVGIFIAIFTVFSPRVLTRVMRYVNVAKANYSSRYAVSSMKQKKTMALSESVHKSVGDVCAKIVRFLSRDSN
jgi:hypothetical protein